MGWRVAANAIACADMGTPYGVWHGHAIAFDVYFSGPVTESAALAVAGPLLPADSGNPTPFAGANPDYSAIPGGTCEQVVYQSPSVAGQETALDPQWQADDKVSVDLYSGAQTSDGADTPYRANSVRFASVTIGGENRGADGLVHC